MNPFKSLYVWLIFQDIDVRFIEFMPFGGNRWTEGRFFAFEDMVSTIRYVLALCCYADAMLPLCWPYAGPMLALC